MDFKRFCIDFKIPIAPKGHAHSRYGWVNISCPLCSGHFGYHMGYNTGGDFFVCYRCGWHPTNKVISSITSITGESLKSLLKKYEGKTKQEVEIEERIRPEQISLPPETGKMTQRHKEYLIGRSFDPEKLERIYNLMGTNHLGQYRFRIIAPITFGNRLVTYQGRDITNKQISKYKACFGENEVISHKHILYGWDQLPYGLKRCLVVEGITGVWRFGPGTLATFGVKYSYSQLRLLYNRFDVIFTLFDPDEAGVVATESIFTKLRAMGKDVRCLEFTDSKYDSGGIFPQEFADKIMKKFVLL